MNAIINRVFQFIALSLLLAFGIDMPAAAQQGCNLVFPPGGSPLTSYITAYPYYTGPATQPLISAFIIDVQTPANGTNYANPPIPYGLYPAWCMDESDDISAPDVTVPGGLFTGTIYSSCDPNLNSELPPGHPDTLISSNNWQLINYILNHQTYNGAPAFYWDVQDAINTLVGSAVGLPGFCGGIVTTPAPSGLCGYPVFDPNAVQALLTDATNNAPTWVPQCGDVVGVIYVTDPTSNQILLLEVPVPCTPCIGVIKQIACVQPTNNCSDFGSVAAGYAGVGCAGINQPAFCYQITVTNCGTIPLTNIVVSDTLLGDLTTNFFTNTTEVLVPGAAVTRYYSMSFSTNATNTVLVQGSASLPSTVTNGAQIYTNGAVVTANDSAVALVDTASVSCNLILYSPLDLDGNFSDNNVTLPAATLYSTPNIVTLSIRVSNTGSSALTGVTITIPNLAPFNCTMPAPFNLAAGASQQFLLCSETATCPGSMNFDVLVNGQIMSDTNHCAQYDITSTNLISVCSSCMGSVTCTTNTTGCPSGTSVISGTVVENCSVTNVTLANDAPLSGVTVILLGAGNTPLATNTTDFKGDYAFPGLASGLYFVQVIPPAGYTETYPVGNTSNEVSLSVVACQNVPPANFGYGSVIPPTITCPPDVVITTNICQMYCSFTPSDWNSSCSGYNTSGCNNNNWSWNWKSGWNSVNNNWWSSWCQNNSTGNSWPSWTNWWTACSGSNPGSNWWNSITNTGNGNHWSGCWTSGQSGNWWNSWNNNNNCNNKSWVPCSGNNPGDILTNWFSTVYRNGCVKIGLTNGYCLTFTSASAVRNCLNNTGNPGVLKCSATNPNTCAAGSFCSQVLALRLNCDFGDCSGAPSFFGRCGDLVVNDPTSPCNGCSVRNILDICNTALGCGALPKGCSLSYLCGLVGNLNQCFEGCQVSSWCSSHCATVYIPSTNQTGVPVVTDECGGNSTVTYSDSISNEACAGTYVITRTWTAIDSRGYSNSCSQNILVQQGSTAGVAGLVVLACNGDGNLSNNQGLNNLTVTLENAGGAIVSTTKTAADGSYSFASLTPGTYTIVLTVPAGYTQTYPAGGANSQTVTLGGCETSTVNFSYTGSTPGVSILKTGPACIMKGQPACYNFAVTNTGNTCLSLQVVDPLLGGVIFSQSAVAPGQGFTFSTNYTVTQSSGSLTNTATVIGTPPVGKPVTNTSSTVGTIMLKCVTNSICENFNSQTPNSGWLWCNAHITANPGKKVTLYCQNASIKVTCDDGTTYNYPVPDGQINFSPTCNVATNWFDGTKWNTTLPCAGDQQIFLNGCAIPCQPKFSSCRSVCWTGVFSCDTAGFNCDWQWGAACYNNNQPGCGSICPKACLNTSCKNGTYYNSNDNCGTPENQKPYCVNGGTGYGNGNYCGSWSNSGYCSW